MLLQCVWQQWQSRGIKKERAGEQARLDCSTALALLWIERVEETTAMQAKALPNCMCVCVCVCVRMKSEYVSMPCCKKSTLHHASLLVRLAICVHITFLHTANFFSYIVILFAFLPKLIVYLVKDF